MITGVEQTCFPSSYIFTSFPNSNSPIIVASRSHFSNNSNTGASRPGVTAINIRSWDSESITSYGVIPFSRLGTRSMNSFSPISERSAISIAAEVIPAAPQSWSPTTPGKSSDSIHASISTFSRNGFPTWTADLISASSWKPLEANPDAPCMPSLPVSAPTSRSRSPDSFAEALATFPFSIKPTHMALTNGFPL